MVNAKEFIENTEGERVKEVVLLKGTEDMDCGKCQFEVEMENGYSFVC